jgi:hypothetical protein
MRITITAVLTLFATLALAQTDVDWKYYGRAVLNERMGKTELTCFYDENSIDHPTSGHVRVWTKCLDQNDMHSFDYHSDLGKKIIKAAAQKIVDLYVPPYAHIDGVSFETAKSIIGDEQLADLSYIQPDSRIFYEFNCPGKMYRELSISMLSGREDRPTNWQYTSPEGNGATLNKLLCDEGVRKMLDIERSVERERQEERKRKSEQR